MGMDNKIFKQKSAFQVKDNATKLCIDTQTTAMI